MRILRALAIIAALSPGIAAAQTLPPGTVQGRLPPIAGPVEAIPFATLLSQLQLFGGLALIAPPTTAGNLACFSATAGFLQDCGVPPGTVGQFVFGTGTGADAFTVHGQQNFYFPAIVSDPGCFCNTFVGNGGANLTHATVNYTTPGVSTTATVTITIASPGVITWTAHGLPAQTPVVFTSTGTLPTGITSGTQYYVSAAGLTTNTFEISATQGGSVINTTGSQSGTITGYTISLEGRYNIGVGQQSLPAITNGSYNTVAGFEGMFNTTSGSWNTGFGEAVLFSNVLGNSNVAVGWKAILENVTGNRNSAVGYGSQLLPISGNDNTSVGYSALSGAANATFSSNTGIGSGVGGVLTSGSSNVLVGGSVGAAMTTGSTNTVVGTGSGTAITTGSNNTIIGAGQTGTAALANEVRLSDGTGTLAFRRDSSGNLYLSDSQPNRNIYNYFSTSTNNAGTIADGGGIWHVFTGLSGTSNWLNVYPDGSTTLGAPTGANEGAGTLNLAGLLYLNGIPLGVGQYPGVSSNTKATAGNIGELVVNSASGAASTVTITIAAPAVVTWTGWKTAIDPSSQNTNYTAGPVTFTNSGGALPTGIISGTTYYIIPIDANTFNIATTPANAFAGTKVTATGTQSGTQTATNWTVLTTTVASNTIAISLPPGEWDVSGVMTYQYAATTTLNYMVSGTSSTSGTYGGQGTFIQYGFPGTAPGAGGGLVQQFGLPLQRFSLSSTTTVFCIATGSFGTSTEEAYGQCRATRVN